MQTGEVWVRQMLVRFGAPGSWIDYELALFREVAQLLDRSTETLFETIRDDFELADQFDYASTLEHWIGLGLAAAQVYLVSSIGEAAAQDKRRDALALPPTVSGLPVASIVNHGANLWKHANEWDWDKPDARRRDIQSTFAALDILDTDMLPLSSLLMKVTGQSTPVLVPLAPLLEAWHDNLDATFPGTA